METWNIRNKLYEIKTFTKLNWHFRKLSKAGKNPHGQKVNAFLYLFFLLNFFTDKISNWILMLLLIRLILIELNYKQTKFSI